MNIFLKKKTLFFLTFFLTLVSAYFSHIFFAIDPFGSDESFWEFFAPGISFGVVMTFVLGLASRNLRSIIYLPVSMGAWWLAVYTSPFVSFFGGGAVGSLVLVLGRYLIMGPRSFRHAIITFAFGAILVATYYIPSLYPALFFIWQPVIGLLIIWNINQPPEAQTTTSKIEMPSQIR